MPDAWYAYPDNEIPTPLFNGSTLKGWKGKIGTYFFAEEGCIVGKNAAGEAPNASTYLFSETQFESFRLVFEARLGEQSEVHSGIAFWGQQMPYKNEAYSYQGHLALFPKDWGLFELYRRGWAEGSVSGNWLRKDDGTAAKASNGQHEWNLIEILATTQKNPAGCIEEARVQVAVNGVQTLTWTDPNPWLIKTAPLGLQLHWNDTDAQQVQWRNLLVSDPKSSSLITTSCPIQCRPLHDAGVAE
eukprot:TRINITY_DN67840_c6_g12_i1.p1 TRINITY_DN67840_c6_g12~~TRINITY_DN67840_c6_g12_i1.p1  ORF type:complete len:287 (+),score=8.97 TRINITY_DN67840_c6_g12_i1:130-861(+)